MSYTKGAWVNRLPRPLRTPAAMTGAAIMLAAVCATAVRDRLYDWLLPKDQWP